MNRPGAWKVALSMIGIFLAGGAAGGFGGAAWSRSHDRPRVSADQFTARFMDRMVKDVQLTQEQIEAIRPMMEDFSGKLMIARRKAFNEVGEVAKEMDRQLEVELTPAQVDLYRKMLARERERWEKRFEAKDKDSAKKSSADRPPPPPAP